MIGLDAWWSGGRRVPVRTRDGTERRVFVRTGGEGPCVTLLHGFPSSSWDFARLVERLAGVGYLALDHLGFGDSDKPARYAYSLFEQLEVLLQIWRARGVEKTWVIAHDYSVSVVQEMLAAMARGGWPGPSVEGVTLLNGGLVFSAIDRKPIQDLLRMRIVGPVLSHLMPEGLFVREFGDVFADAHRPSLDELAEHFRAVTHRGGRAAIARVARYLEERREHEARWSKALAEAPVPVRYVWGLEDPISGPSILAALRDRVDAPDVVELEGVGHYPQIEAPDAVLEAALLPTA